MDSRSIKMSVIGDASAGKSTLLYKFKAGEYSENISPTIGAAFSELRLILDTQKITLETWDVSLGERLESLLNVYIKDRDFAIICCEKSNKNCRESIQYYIDLIRKNNGLSVPIFVLLTKTDLNNEAKDLSDVHELISETRHCKYLGEISAKDNTKEEIGALFCRAILEFNNTPLQEFLDAHAQKTKDIKCKWWRPSFFNRTHIRRETTLPEAILDARHKESSTANKVFFEKGWLDANGQVPPSAPQEMKDADQLIRINRWVFKK